VHFSNFVNPIFVQKFNFVNLIAPSKGNIFNNRSLPARVPVATVLFLGCALLRTMVVRVG